MHVLDIEQLSSQQIAYIYQLAEQLQLSQAGLLLEGKHFVLFFPATSVRTRMTFERGIQALGGTCTLFPPDTLDRREQLQDTAAYIGNWADGIVVRHDDDAKIKELARHSPIPVINAMSAYQHPCEVLADLYAISRIRPNYRELNYTFVGPAGNVVRSWAAIAKVMNLRFTHVCTADQAVAEPSPNYSFLTSLEDAIQGSDVVLTDSLPDAFRTADYIGQYQITSDTMKLANPHALLNPCPPFFRGEEVSEEVIASSYFVGHAFKTSLLQVQQAVLFYCLSH